MLPQGWRISGTSRDPARDRAAVPPGVTLHRFDGSEKLDPALFAGAQAILGSIPPGPDGDPALACHAADLSAAGAAWIGYLSTTGVYGDAGGAWVDEDSPLKPDGVRGRRRVAAEAGWQALRPAAHVFRLSAIYGPGRGVLEQVRAGTAKRIVKPGQVFNRIHVADIAQVLEASIRRPAPGRVYNLADDCPVPPQDVIVHCAALLGIAPPPEIPFTSADLSPMSLSFFAECKRVANRRIKEELGVRLLYPDYRAGLAVG